MIKGEKNKHERYISANKCQTMGQHTLVKKRNSSPFHLQILKLPDGVQASNETLAIPVLPVVVSKFANEKARSLLFE